MEFLASLHPQVVHFPIAIFITYMLFEFLSVTTGKEYFSKSAQILLFLGILGALVAVFTGNQAEELLKEVSKNVVPRDLIEEHEEYATITMWYFVFILIIRTYYTVKKKLTKKIQIIILILSILGFYLIYETGEHGGELVYKYGAGTELLKENK